MNQRGLTKITDELLGIVIDKSTFLYGFFNGREIRISENHIRRKFGDIRSASHSHTDISFLQRWCVIHTIASLQRNNNLSKTSIMIKEYSP